MNQFKQILTTEKGFRKPYLPPIIEVEEVEEDGCILAASPIGTEVENPEDKGGDDGPTRPGGRAKEGDFVFDDPFSDDGSYNLDFMN